MVAAWPVPDLRLVPAGAGRRRRRCRLPITGSRRRTRAGCEEGRGAAGRGGRPPDRGRLPGARRRGRVAAGGAGGASRVEAEESLYALATALAHQIVQRELATDPTIVRDLVRRARRRAAARRHRSRSGSIPPISPRSAPSSTSTRPAVGSSTCAGWPSPTIERGGYLIETSQRVVDGRIDPVLKRDVRAAARWLARPTPRWSPPRSAAPPRCPGSRFTAGSPA